jgi:hypothetical protein
MKRVVVVIAGLVIVIGLGGLGAWWYIGRTGSSDIEQWIGRQIVGILESHITPSTTFRSIDYRAPKTVVIEGLVLRAEGQPIISVERAMLELAERPRRDRPIQIARVELDRPALKFVVEPGRLVGWSGFVREEVLEDPKAIPPGRRFSDVLVLQYVGIRDGRVIYQDDSFDTEPMTLSGIDLNLRTPRAGGAGWYGLAGELYRKDLFELKIDGRINLDTALLELSNLELAAEMGPQQYNSLPPQLQRILKEYEVAGAVSANWKGSIPLMEPERSSGRLAFDLKGGRVAIADAMIPVEHLKVEASLPDGPIDIRLADSGLHSGEQSIVSIGSLEAHIPTIPSGDGLEIDRLLIGRPRIVLARTEQGGFAGFSAFDDDDDDEEEGSADDTDAEWIDRLKLGDAQIREGSFCFIAGPSADHVDVRNIGLRLKTEAGHHGRNLLAAEGEINSKPLVSATFTASYDPHEQTVDVGRLEVAADIGPGRDSLLPASWTRYKVKGAVNARWTGKVPLRDPKRAVGDLALDLIDGHIQTRKASLPVGQLHIEAKLPDGPLEVQAADASLEAAGKTLVSFGRLDVQLARLPRGGRPVEVDRLIVDQPVVRLVRMPDGRFEGFEAFEAFEDTEADPSEEGHWLDRLTLSHAQIRRGSLTYDGPAMDPFTVPGIGLNVTTRELANQRRVLAFEGSVDRRPLLSGDFAAYYDPKRSILQVQRVRIDGNLADPLPPDVPATIAENPLRGQFSILGSGVLPLDDLEAGHSEFRARLERGSVRVGQINWPVNVLMFDGRWNGPAVGGHIRANMLGGRADVSGNMALTPDRSFDARWNVDSLNVEKVLLAMKSERPRYSGQLSSQGQARGQLGHLRGTLNGSATVDIRHGRLLQLPVLRELVQLISKVRIGLDLPPTDTARFELTLANDHVLIRRGEVVSSVAAMTGNGRVFYDSRLELSVNAGVLKRLEVALGKIGDLLGALEDRVVSYRVRGTVQNPKVTVAPLGIGQR